MDGMAEEGKKKSSKLPIIAAMVILLAGGGFFVLKGQGGNSKEKAKVELADKETDLDEFLTNCADPAVYVRAKITVRLRKDYDESKFKDNTGDIRDAVLAVLNSTSPKDITDTSKRPFLKHELAEAMNTALQGTSDDSSKDDEEKSKKHKHSSDDSDDSAADGWDSKTGPVLKVRFVNLATQ